MLVNPFTMSHSSEETPTSPSDSSAASTSMQGSEKLSLDFLIKLVPDNFDGDRYKLRSFIKQVDSVFELAQPGCILPYCYM